ncbi:DUF4127 family protein [Pelomyxa schiedti]|nr:DUF4127 family protein [Pelomyxa schiedti]
MAGLAGWCIVMMTMMGAVVMGGGVNTQAVGGSILYLPLDERYTTRNAFLNLAGLVPWEILTPPLELLPSLKVPPPMEDLHAWVDQNMPYATAAIISSEMFIYGGLIQSRISNDTMETVENRLQKLLSYKTTYPKLELFLSAVVMRIPDYNSDFEEPWYWEDYGELLFEFSYYTDKYYHTHDPVDKALAEEAASEIPSNVMKEFLWRRSRNFNITKDLIDDEYASNPCRYIYITQDDNAEYGFNIEEANALRRMVAEDNLGDHVFIYPGADEVALTMLSMLSVFSSGISPTINLVFRDPTTIYNIPNYEAAGGTIVNSSEPDIFMLVNNFSEDYQLEAPNQPFEGRSIDDYSLFTPFLLYGGDTVFGFADNRYSNGGDLVLLDYLYAMHSDTDVALDMGRFCYAGWNTDGNTLGTVISNTIILSLFQSRDENTFFNTLRITEDEYYQADLRQSLEDYVNRMDDATCEDLTSDLPFYEEFSWKALAARMRLIDSSLGAIAWSLDSCYYPWNRTFEIGFVAH